MRIYNWLKRTAAAMFVGVIFVPAIASADMNHAVQNAGFDGAASGSFTYDLGGWGFDNSNTNTPTWITNGYYSDESSPTNSAIYSTSDLVFQDLVDTFVEGRTYTFTLDIGGRAGDFDWDIFFYNATDGNPFTSIANSTGSITLAANDPWNAGLATVSYTATAADDGDVIGIGFGGASTSYYTLYDNAVVSSTAAIPEPATGLIAFGLLGAAALRRRKN